MEETFVANEDRGFIFGTTSNNDKYQRKLMFLLQPDGTLRAWCPLVLTNAAGREIPGLGEDDGTQRMQLVLWETAAPAAQVRWRAEPTGEACVSLYAWDGAALIQPLTEADGSVRSSLVGTDEVGNEDSLRTDASRIVWNRPYDRLEDIASAEIPVAEGDLWSPAVGAAVLYQVWYMIVNNDAGGAAVTVSVGRDVGAGGGLAAPEYWTFNEIIPYPGQTEWRGGRYGFRVAGNDAIRGIASVANDASIHFMVKRVDTAS